MPITTLKQKGQITLPADIRKKLHASTGDLFDCEFIDGKVVMTLQKIEPVTNKRSTQKENSRRNLSKWIGATPGVFSSGKDIDDFIRNERNTWED